MFCQKCGKEVAPDTKFCGSCGHDMSPAESTPPAIVKKEQTFSVSQLSPLTVIYVIVIGALSVIGSLGLGIIGLIIWYIASVYAINNMTYKVKGSVDWAFAIIMTFGLIGYICYWIWFLNKRNNMVESN